MSKCEPSSKQCNQVFKMEDAISDLECNMKLTAHIINYSKAELCLSYNTLKEVYKSTSHVLCM